MCLAEIILRHFFYGEIDNVMEIRRAQKFLKGMCWFLIPKAIPPILYSGKSKSIVKVDFNSCDSAAMIFEERTST